MAELTIEGECQGAWQALQLLASLTLINGIKRTKQGTGKSTISGQKVEPKSQGINPEYAAEIGRQTAHHRSVPMYKDRGIQAPKASASTHKCGSQGKY
jgi:hypothetical protein